MAGPLAFVVDGRPVEVPDDGCSLLEALRDRLGIRSPKDGCSPQGQCGCCTVLVDGQPRVACVTPARRVAGRQVTTVDGLEDAGRWADAFTAAGASQCGFCTPGIVVRLAGACAWTADRGHGRSGAPRPPLPVHGLADDPGGGPRDGAGTAGAGPGSPLGGRRGARRARLEGRAPQVVGAEVALGRGGFADDTAPLDALVAVRSIGGDWVVGETLAEARAAAGKVQGRRTTVPLRWPIELPAGEWVRTLRTTWVEPGYLETDASWCVPGGEPVTALANGGAFGGKVTSEVGEVARRLADAHGRPVRVLFAREDAVRWGPKRPPLAAGVRADGSGVVRVARTTEIAAAIVAAAPGLQVEEVDVTGPPTSAAVRAAGWAEAAVLVASLGRGAGHGALPRRSRGDGGHRERRSRRGVGPMRADAGRGRAPVVLHRRRAHGARLGALGGHRRRRPGGAARPHDPLVRHPPGGRHAAASR